MGVGEGVLHTLWHKGNGEVAKFSHVAVRLGSSQTARRSLARIWVAAHRYSPKTTAPTALRGACGRPNLDGCSSSGGCWRRSSRSVRGRRCPWAPCRAGAGGGSPVRSCASQRQTLPTQAIRVSGVMFTNSTNPANPILVFPIGIGFFVRFLG